MSGNPPSPSGFVVVLRSIVLGSSVDTNDSGTRMKPMSVNQEKAPRLPSLSEAIGSPTAEVFKTRLACYAANPGSEPVLRGLRAELLRT